MAFTAPVLWTEIDATNYQSQLDLNFQKIQAALYNIQNELSAIGVISSGLSPSNLSWIERAIRYEGVIGTQAFTPVFDSDEETVTITHPGQDSLSSAIVNGLFHYTRSEVTLDLTQIAAAGNGIYYGQIGIKTLGAPAMELTVDSNETDSDQDLVLWSFTYSRSGSSYHVSNLRREAEVLMDRDSFTKAFDREQHVFIFRTGALASSPGYLNSAFVPPFNLEILGVEFYLNTAPSGSTLELGLVPLSNQTDGNILATTASWTIGQNGARSVEGTTPPALVESGDPIKIERILADSGGSAAGLSALIRYRRVYHDVLI